MMIDALGQQFDPPILEQRILSLVPSTTETLCALGLRNRIVGVTRYCVHPTDILENVPQVGGTKQLNWHMVDELKAGFAIGNKEENNPSFLTQFQKRKIDYFVAFPKTVDEAIMDIQNLGTLLGAHEQAQTLCSDIQLERAKFTPKKSFTYAYLIWRKPWMTIGTTTFISELLSEVMGINVFNTLPTRYPTVSLTDIKEHRPDVILLSSEPYSFKQEHIEELRSAGLSQPILPINGEYCSWHGVRLKGAFNYLQKQYETIMEHIR